MIPKIAAILLFFFFYSCQNRAQEETNLTDSPEINASEQKVTRVATITLKRGNFQKQIISQGKIEARTYSDVSFDLQERIEEVLVKTGQRVKKGDLLARLRNFETQNQLQKIDHQIEKAKVDLEAKLISLGYAPEDSLQIPPAVLKTARLESNLAGLEIDRALVLYKLESAQVRAPISGIVAEVEAQAGNLSSSYKKLCTIIDDGRLEAVFPILEQELPLVREGQKVMVKPLHTPGKSYAAVISAYLPQVDEQGMIKVFARLPRPDNRLLDGMHATVYIREEVNGQLVVPKSAVVDRQGRLVVFVHKDGQAHWNYVQIGLENSDSYTISEGLREGDEVIVSNNFHLAHLEEVEIDQ
jgi:RND family efflux transporter MFP subunit